MANTGANTGTNTGTNTGSNLRMHRSDVVPQLVGDNRDFLIIAGLAGTAKDIEGLELGADNAFVLGGAMGAAVSTGIGLAVMQPDRQVLVATGDGELLMNIGALATVVASGVERFSILCVDNERYGETGNQITHTSMGTDLAAVARGFGIKNVLTVTAEDEIPAANAMLRRADGPNFVHLKVNDGPPTRPPGRSWDEVERKLAFRKALLGHS